MLAEDRASVNLDLLAGHYDSHPKADRRSNLGRGITYEDRSPGRNGVPTGRH